METLVIGNKGTLFPTSNCWPKAFPYVTMVGKGRQLTTGAQACMYSYKTANFAL